MISGIDNPLKADSGQKPKSTIERLSYASPQSGVGSEKY